MPNSAQLPDDDRYCPHCREDKRPSQSHCFAHGPKAGAVLTVLKKEYLRRVSEPARQWAAAIEETRARGRLATPSLPPTPRGSPPLTPQLSPQGSRVWRERREGREGREEREEEGEREVKEKEGKKGEGKKEKEREAGKEVKGKGKEREEGKEGKEEGKEGKEVKEGEEGEKGKAGKKATGKDPKWEWKGITYKFVYDPRADIDRLEEVPH